jgi:phosphoribosylanthranilate isomerase
VFVKVCGITRAEDADLAAELGARALGFVFWPGSARYISRASARAIVRRNAGRVNSVGVFVDQSLEEVIDIMDAVGLDVAQLHGSESPEYCREVVRLAARMPEGRELAVPESEGQELAVPKLERREPAVSKPEGRRQVIKAIGLHDSEPVAIEGFDPDVLILVDAHDPSRYGGTGRTVNWDIAKRIAASRRTILAGGLNPENIARAIETVRPYGVDVSSGVETTPGVKDASRLRRFFEALE